MLANSFEIVIRDNKSLTDYIYDAKDAKFSNVQNYRVSEIITL